MGTVNLQSGSTEIRLGADVVNKEMEEVDKGFESIDAVIWKAYLEGDVVTANKRISAPY